MLIAPLNLLDMLTDALLSIRHVDKITVHLFDARSDFKLDRALLAIHFHSRILSIYTLARTPSADTLHVSPALHTLALSATRITGFRGHVSDLLIVKPDNTLTVFTHGIRQVSLRLAPRQAPSSPFGTQTSDAAIQVPNAIGETDDVMSVDGSTPTSGDDNHSDVSMHSVIDKEKIVAVSEPLHTSVTVHFEDGSTTRTRLIANSHDFLTSQCFTVLSYALTGPRAFALNCSWLEKWRATGPSDEGDEEWTCFVDAICEMFDIRSPYHVEGATGATPGTWEALAYSASHERLEHDAVFKYLDASFRPQRPIIEPAKKQPHPDIVPCLHALHILGEHYKLMNDAINSYLPRLAKLLIVLGQAARPEWADYWVRLFPDIYEGWADPKRQGMFSSPHALLAFA
jgi:anaphase-promoting complex subunit 1